MSRWPRDRAGIVDSVIVNLGARHAGGTWRRSTTARRTSNARAASLARARPQCPCAPSRYGAGGVTPADSERWRSFARPMSVTQDPARPRPHSRHGAIHRRRDARMSDPASSSPRATRCFAWPKRLRNWCETGCKRAPRACASVSARSSLASDGATSAGVVNRGPVLDAASGTREVILRVCGDAPVFRRKRHRRIGHRAPARPGRAAPCRCARRLRAGHRWNAHDGASGHHGRSVSGEPGRDRERAFSPANGWRPAP